MFWKKFKQSQSANKLFNQASECWRQSQQFLLEGNQKAADEACVEVLRLCQLAIESDERMGDAYILLANMLMSMAFQISEEAEPSRRDYLMSRAMATIHLWHSLPYRNYPISKNAKIGEQIWTTAVQELVNSKSLSETAVISLLDSYRDSLAMEATSPESFDKLKSIILENTSEKQIWPHDTSEDALTPETRHFLINILPEVLQRKGDNGQIPLDRSFSPEKFLDSLKYEGKIPIADLEIAERIQQAFHNNDFCEVIGWLGWLYLLCRFQEMIQADSEFKEKSLAVKSKFFGDVLATAVHEAKQKSDWNGLLMSIGPYDLVGVSEKGDEVLQYLCDKIGKQDVEHKIQDMERRPRMLTEGSLINRLKRRLEKS